MADENEHGKFSRGIKSALDATKAKAKKVSGDADWVFGRTTVRVLGAVALFAIVVAFLLVFLDWYIAPTKASEKKDLVLAIALILAGTALLSGLYFTWRTLQVNREGQITERFTRAIEQLGATHADNSKNLELRLGGIYALERIARESEEDHWSIMEVLTAYVRQHAHYRPEEAKQAEEAFAAGREVCAIRPPRAFVGRRRRGWGTWYGPSRVPPVAGSRRRSERTSLSLPITGPTESGWGLTGGLCSTRWRPPAGRCA